MEKARHPQGFLLAACAAVLVLAPIGCGSKGSGSAPASAQPRAKALSEVPTTITAFSVTNENLNVDKVGMRDGFFKPDGNRDLAFSATVNGPVEAIFLVSCNDKGEPGYGLRADTLVGSQDLPTELGGVVDTGRMTVGIGVFEDGRLANGDSGSLSLGEGIHQLSLYTPNTANVRGGTFVRMYVRTPSGSLVPGPVTPY